MKSEAGAKAVIRIPRVAVDRLLGSAAEKTDPTTLAREAGERAATETARLNPAPTPVSLEQAHVLVGEPVYETENAETATFLVESRVAAVGEADLKVEALMAVSVAVLCLRDRCQAPGEEVEVVSIELVAADREGTQ